MRGKYGLEPLLCFLGKARQGKGNGLGLATLNNCHGLWELGAVPSCL